MVTGATSGIGRATALRLVEDGLRVLAVGRRAEPLTSLPSHDRLAKWQGDLRDPQSCDDALDAATRLGRPLVVIHAAGVAEHADHSIWDRDPTASSWRDTMAVNLDAAYHLLVALAPHVRAAGWGRFVGVSSTAATVPAAGQPAYSASKAGLLGLIRSAACDLAQVGGTCNAVAPGWVRDTNMAQCDAEAEAARRSTTVEQVWAERDESYPGGRVLNSNEVADVIVFLVSDGAAAINAEAITVAGGSVW